MAYGNFNGPIKVTGTAGTGKTVAALHRAYHLAKSGQRVLLCTYVKVLCANLKRCLRLLCKDEPEVLNRISVSTVHSEAHSIMRGAGSKPHVLSRPDLLKEIEKSKSLKDCPLTAENVLSEWINVIEAQGLTTWEQYAQATRAGMGRPLQSDAREKVWAVIAPIMRKIAANRAFTWPFLAHRAHQLIQSGRAQSNYDAVVIDEVQDLGVCELRFLHSLAPESLSLMGDGGQRIYARAISLQALGINVRGRSFNLKINYRTTSEIRRFADKLQVNSSDDLDGDKESRRNVVSIIQGKEPTLRVFPRRKDQIDFVAEKIAKHLTNGEAPETIAIIARTQQQLKGYYGALNAQGIDLTWIKQGQGVVDGAVNLCNMHGGKGLEFRIVFVTDVSDGIVPLAAAYEDQDDPLLRDEELVRERNLLYVSCTRARDILTVTAAKTPSRFLAPHLSKSST